LQFWSIIKITFLSSGQASTSSKHELSMIHVINNNFRDHMRLIIEFRNFIELDKIKYLRDINWDVVSTIIYTWMCVHFYHLTINIIHTKNDDFFDRFIKDLYDTSKKSEDPLSTKYLSQFGLCFFFGFDFIRLRSNN
jgi:hypothetical protein